MKSRLFNYIKQLSDEECSLLSQAQIFNIDNVAEYYWQSPQEDWSIKNDFPILSLPFDTCYFEYRVPNDDVLLSCGVLAQNHGHEFGGTPVTYLIYFETKKACFYTGGGRLLIDDKGRSMPLPGHEPHNMIFFVPEGLGVETEEDREEYKANITTALHPCWLAISFLHCKNVTIDPRGVGLNRGKRVRHEPNFRYHVLVIEPMKKILKTEGRSDEVGLKRALHICRGHFKDFRETGLFGKFRDIYWWNPQVRGKVENGIVLKDYNVDAPKEPEEK